MPRLAVVLCLLLVAVPRAAEKWTYAVADHFEVYATGGDRQARDALTYFERVHAFFTEFLKLQPRTGPPTRLIIFTSDRQFAPYSPNAVAAAFYLSAPDREYIVMKSLDENAQPVVVHEYAHQVFRQAGARYPLWLNEGLAEFFSTMAPDGNRMEIGRPIVDRLQYLIDGAAMLPMERLLAVTHDDPEYNTRGHVGVFYSQSWALTHMLLADSRYKAKASELFSLVSKGRPGGDAFMSVYGKTLAVVATDLANYVRQSQYTVFFYAYKAPPPLGRLPTRPADAFEADLMTANLLANLSRRESDARAAFERLAAVKPTDVSLAESRAYFELRRGHREAALPHFARAVEGGSRSPKLYRDYASLDPAKAEELLATVIQLSPEDVESRIRYAVLLQVRRRNADIVATLAPVKDPPRETGFVLYRLLANAYMQLERVEEARVAAVQAEVFARTPAETADAQRLTKSIQDYAMRGTLQARSTQKPGSPAPAPGQTTVTETPRLGDLTREPPLTATGKLVNVECRPRTPTVIEVRTNTQLIRLVVDNPSAIQVLGRPTPTVDLKCGGQNVTIRVGYVAASDANLSTIGSVRLLDYRQP